MSKTLKTILRITVLVVGGARYHFPFLPTMMIGAAWACEYLFAGQRQKRQIPATGS